MTVVIIAEKSSRVLILFANCKDHTSHYIDWKILLSIIDCLSILILQCYIYTGKGYQLTVYQAVCQALPDFQLFTLKKIMLK